MKKFFFIALLLLPTVAFSQLKPRIAFDYFPGGYNTQLNIPVALSCGAQEWNVDVPRGNFRIRIGADYSIFYFDQSIYMNKGIGASFNPIQAEWAVGIKYKYKGLTFRFEHLCIHPIGNSGIEAVKIYGGYDMISVGWGY